MLHQYTYILLVTIGGSTTPLGLSWYLDHHHVTMQVQCSINFQGEYVIVKMFVTHFAITVAHQILALVTNIMTMSCYTNAHTFCWLHLLHHEM